MYFFNKLYMFIINTPATCFDSTIILIFPIRKFFVKTNYRPIEGLDE